MLLGKWTARTLLMLMIAVGLSHCTRSPLKERENALRVTGDVPDLSDDLPIEPLISALEGEITFLKSSTRVRDFKFGSVTFTKDEYIRGLQHLIDVAKSGPDAKTAILKALKEDFDFYEVYGNDDWGDVFITSYFEPVLKGSTQQTKEFTRPLYRMPDDMLEIPLSRFNGFGKNGRTLIGRLYPKLSSRGFVQVVPYFTRAEIDSDGALLNKKLEIVWVDSIEAFFLQIQGSGTVQLQDGKSFRLGYAGQNGHPYEALGKFLKNVIPIEKMTLHTIEDYLRTLPPEKVQEYLNKNPSYVFFKELDGEPITYIGTPVVAGRTIATDIRYFPKGALGFMSFKKPEFASPTDKEPAKWSDTSRLVIDQDRGGAISGGGRVDLFWGSGPEAKQNAGVMKGEGKLYYIAPKRSWLGAR